MLLGEGWGLLLSNGIVSDQLYFVDALRAPLRQMVLIQLALAFYKIIQKYHGQNGLLQVKLLPLVRYLHLHNESDEWRHVQYQNQLIFFQITLDRQMLQFAGAWQ